MQAQISLSVADRIKMSIHDVFYQMEEEQDLFTLQLADGTYYWDIIRTELFAGLNAAFKRSTAYPKSEYKLSITTIIKDFVKASINELTLSYLIRCKPEYIFTTFQRQKQNCLFVDNIMDHLYELVSDKSICVEHINKVSISYQDIILGRKTRIPPVYVSAGKKDSDVDAINETITNVVNKYFNVSINIYDIVHDPIKTFKENRNYYRRLFSKFLPKVLVCGNNGTLKGLYCAAREAQIPTVELQHGISPGSIMWTYSEKYRKPHSGLIVPDVFLTLADCWNSENEYPTTKTYSVGNDNLYQASVIGEDGILIISNLMFHEDLVALTLELTDLIKEKKIYYKLHPQQYDHKADVVSIFSEYGNVEVISDEMNSTELFESCNHVVGVRSTLLYIALQAGKNVYLYKRHNYSWDKHLLKYVALFKDAVEFKKLIDDAADKTPSNPPVFIQKFDPKKFMQILHNIGS
jgi:hypothetical protein